MTYTNESETCYNKKKYKRKINLAYFPTKLIKDYHVS